MFDYVKDRVSFPIPHDSSHDHHDCVTLNRRDEHKLHEKYRQSVGEF